MMTDLTIAERLDQLTVYAHLIAGMYGVFLILYLFMILLSIPGIDIFSYDQEEQMKKNLPKTIIRSLAIGAFFAVTVKF